MRYSFCLCQNDAVEFLSWMEKYHNRKSYSSIDRIESNRIKLNRTEPNQHFPSSIIFYLSISFLLQDKRTNFEISSTFFPATFKMDLVTSELKEEIETENVDVDHEHTWHSITESYRSFQLVALHPLRCSMPGVYTVSDLALH